MPGSNYSDARLLEQRAAEAFQRVLNEHGRRAPALTRVEVEQQMHLPFISFTAEFSNGHRRTWEIDQYRLTTQGQRDALHPSVEIEFRTLYSRLYENHLIEIDLNVAREAYIGVISSTSDPEARRVAARSFDQHADMIRRQHRGVYPGSLLGLDLGRPGSDQTAVTVRVPLRGRRAEFTIMDDVETATINWSQMTATVIEPDSVPAPQSAALLAMAEVMQAQVHARLNLNYAAVFDEFTRHMFGDAAGTDEANAKGLKLLKDWLTPEQLSQYERINSFEVKGGTTGKRYRIRHGRQMNIDELDANGKKVTGWCFLPEGQLVAGDVMLAQKIALETNELAALKVANRIPISGLIAGTTNNSAYLTIDFAATA